MLLSNLDLTERLELAAGHAERHYGAAVARQHRRNDGVERPLATGDGVGMAALKHKTAGAVVKDDA